MLARLFLAAALAPLALPLASQAQTASSPAATPPAAAAPAAPAVALMPSPGLVPAAGVMATLAGNPHFSMLAKFLTASGVAPALSNPQLTLFAPTNEAFQALPPATLAFLSAPANVATLQKVMTYHLVHLDLDASKIKGAKGPVQTVEEQNVQVDGSPENPAPMINDAHIIQMDVHAGADLIQVVDKVLLPTDVTLPR